MMSRGAAGMAIKPTPFSHHVVDCIRRGDFAALHCMFSGPYIVNERRMREGSEENRLGWPSPPSEPDDWSLSLTGWCFGLFPRVALLRGPERFCIKLTKEEHRGLADIHRAIFESIKDEERAKKRLYRENQSRAYWHKVCEP